jgi:hypothetical protein
MTVFFDKLFALFWGYYCYVVFLFWELDALLHIYNACTYCYQVTEDEKELPVPEIKYEDKYLEKFNQLQGTALTDEKKESLKNAFTMEYSPVGNIIMYYDTARESFTYYCDNTVPFRYLEPVSRKYVIDFDCKTLYKTHTEEEKSEETVTVKQPQPKKQMKTKDILSGFKTGAKQQPAQQKGDAIVKATNRYTAMGRLSNFSILKKVDRCAVDKNYKMTFSDFKKMKTNKT